MSDTYYLHAGTAEAQPAVTLGQGFPETVNSLPAFYFWRKAARDGGYVHPIKKWHLSITPERRRKWVETFGRMRANGVQVPIVEDHKEQASKALGYVVDVRNAGDWYEELHQYLGEDARTLALRNGVSVGIHPNFHDGCGRSYGEAIFHSAITPGPVVPGAGALAASRGQDSGVDVFQLARSETETSMLQLTDEQIAKLKPLLGDGITNENFAAKLVEKFTTTCELSRTQGTKVTELEGKITTLTAEKTAADAKVIELSRGTATELPAEVLDGLVDADESALDGLVIANCISPACKDKLAKVLIKGEDGKPKTLMLSRTHSGTPVRISRAVIDALKENKVVATGRQAGVQTQELSRSAPGEGEDKNRGEQTAEEIKARVERIGGSKAPSFTM